MSYDVIEIDSQIPVGKDLSRAEAAEVVDTLTQGGLGRESDYRIKWHRPTPREAKDARLQVINSYMQRPQ